MKEASPRISTTTVSSSPSDSERQGLILHWNHAANDEKQETQPFLELTTTERQELSECENILVRGLATFFQVGNALLQIREKRLYRATHSTFEQYCRDRWHIGRSYACRVIGAAERINLLPDNADLPKPANEFQVRPFLKLPAEQFPDAWRRAVDLAKAGKVTPKVAQAALQIVEPNGTIPRDSAQCSKTRRKRKIPLGQIIALLFQARRCVEKNLSEQAIETLDRIESILFGPD